MRFWDGKVKNLDNVYEAKGAERREIEYEIDGFIDLLPKTHSDSIGT